MTSPSLMAERAGSTNAQGVFIARLLPPGSYTIEVSAPGFQNTRLSNRTIGMDQNFQPRIRLQPVGVEVVDVVGGGAVLTVDPTDVKSSTNFDAKAIDRLPMGRDINSQVNITPGVSPGVGGRTTIRGAMSSGNLYLVDGMAMMDNIYNTVATHLITDTYEETQIIRGAISAEYGNVDGGVVNTLTKSGGNTFTGMYRVELSNPEWNAVRAKTPRRNPDGSSTPTTNKLNEVKQYSLGGFFWKDRIWFHIGVRETDTSTVQTFSPASTTPEGKAGLRLPYTSKSQFITGKLTFRITEDHSVVVAYSDNENKVANWFGNNNGYRTSGYDTTAQQVEASDWYNVSWRALWNSNLNTELRYGKRKQSLTTGPQRSDWKRDDVTYSPIQDIGTGLVYNMGIFGFVPGVREITTGNAKASYFLDLQGMHELDFGIDYYKGNRYGMNAQSVTAHTFYAYEVDGTNKTAIMKYPGAPRDEAGDYNFWYNYEDAQVGQTRWGIYLNDKWKLNNHWAFQIGLRYDTYSADATDKASSIATASGFSPRLGITYDLFGDQQWVFKASYCQYQAAVLEAISNAASSAGSINYYYCYWNGPEGVVPWSEVFNMSNYETVPYGSYVAGGTIQVAKSMKPPTVDEFQLSAAYTFATENWGQGAVQLTWVKKSWNNLIDYTRGRHGQVRDNNGNLAWLQIWDNQPLAEREYEGLELEAGYQYGKWTLMGNITWSKLEGNYVGEGSASPGSGQGIGLFDYTPDEDGKLVKHYDWQKLNPYGRLTGDRPIVINLTADYTTDSALGRTSIGLVYKLQSGSPMTYSRVITSRADLSPTLPSGFGSSWTQYMDGQRTHGRYHSTVYHDLAITHDFNLFKVYGTQVTAFAKLIIYNVFNHTQIATWNVEYANAATQAAEWVPVSATNFGTAHSSSYYGSPRTIGLNAGFRF